jgi:hypothetical protein
VDLVVLDGSALDGLGSLLDQTGDDDCTFGADSAAELDHLLAQLVASGNDGLDGAEVLAQVQESQLRRLRASVLNPAAEGDLLVNVVGNIVEADAGDARGLELLRAGKRKLAVGVFRDVFGVSSLLLRAFGEFAGLRRGLLLCLARQSVTDIVI